MIIINKKFYPGKVWLDTEGKRIQAHGGSVMFLNGKYRHFKGNEYEVIDVAKHSETLEEMIVYRALYGEGGLWVRPKSMFLETVIRDDVEYKRFEYIG